MNSQKRMNTDSKKCKTFQHISKQFSKRISGSLYVHQVSLPEVPLRRRRSPVRRSPMVEYGHIKLEHQAGTSWKNHETCPKSSLPSFIHCFFEVYIIYVMSHGTSQKKINCRCHRKTFLRVNKFNLVSKASHIIEGCKLLARNEKDATQVRSWYVAGLLLAAILAVASIGVWVWIDHR